MKIIHVEDYFDSEAGYQVNDMLRIKTEDNIFLICTDDMTPFHKIYDTNQREKDKIFEEKYNIKIIRLPLLFKFSGRAFYKKLFKTIKEINPDILFLHGIGDYKDLYFLMSKKKKYKIFRDCHMSWVASKNRFAKIYYKVFSFIFGRRINKTEKYEKIYALGAEEEEYLLKLGITKEKIEYLPHGYNKKNFFKDDKLRSEIRKQLKVEDDEILISYVGKFDNSKKPHLTLLAYEKLLKEINEKKLRFLYVGSKDEKYMEEVFYPILNKISFKDRIEILNAKKFDELNGIYNASDICFWPQETTLSSIHAQASGTVCVMENHISNRERVVLKEYLYNIGDLDSAVEKLKDLIEKGTDNKSNVIINSDSLLKREYNYQVKRLYDSWRELIG